MNVIYQTALLPTLQKLPEGTVFQEDNDPKHCSRLCQAWKADHHIQSLSWPTCSPDLNPIQNVWALLKAKIDWYKITSLKGLRQAIHKEWNRLPLALAQNLAKSLPRRLAQVVTAKGDNSCN